MSADPVSGEPGRELAALAHGLRAEVRRRRRRGQHRTAAPPRPATAPAAPATAPAALATAAAAPPAGGADTPETIRARAAACGSLAELAAAVAACTACPLHATRTQTVFADGDGSARVAFVGEAPGFHEDQQGVPFVGRAGQLLTDIVTRGMGLEREHVYIANVLKCRPPENRDPTAAEKALCTPWLDRQLELVGAEVVIPLGRHAAAHLLGTEDSMGRMRGRVHERGGRRIVPTYHPAFLLRSPGMKKECWKDIQLAMAELGLEPPERR